MYLKRLKLNNFRNYTDIDFEFQENKTLLVGKNAQGKTNLLEAVYYLSCLNSNRIKKDSELITFGKEHASIYALTHKNQTNIELEVNINPPKKKILKVNSLKKNKSAEFVRVLSVVSFSSADLLLMRGEPSDRRKWLDMAICQVYPVYADKLAKYNKIRLQKSNFLAQFPMNTSMLDVFNTQLAISAANIIYLRIKFLNELNKTAKIKHASIAKGEELLLKYDSCICSEIKGVKEITELAALKLEELKDDEIRRAQCLAGPHRDDISIFINNIDAKKYASQGQQRTVVLALKLAELDIIKEKINELPVLLLDDVLAELDNIRQNYLLNAIEKDVQTIITSVDTLAFDKEFLSGVEIVNIKDGKVLKN